MHRDRLSCIAAGAGGDDLPLVGRQRPLERVWRVARLDGDIEQRLEMAVVDMHAALLDPQHPEPGSGARLGRGRRAGRAQAEIVGARFIAEDLHARLVKVDQRQHHLRVAHQRQQLDRDRQRLHRGQLVRELRRSVDRDVVGDDRRHPPEPHVQMRDGHRSSDRGAGLTFHQRDEPVPSPQQDQEHQQEHEDADGDRAALRQGLFPRRRLRHEPVRPLKSANVPPGARFLPRLARRRCAVPKKG